MLDANSIQLQSTTQQLSTASLGKGIYFYQVRNEDGKMNGNGKVVKHKTIDSIAYLGSFFDGTKKNKKAHLSCYVII